MTLSKSFIPVIFNSGIDIGTNPQFTSQKLLKCENGLIDKDGLIEKRPGSVVLAPLIDSTTDYSSVSTDGERYLGRRGDNLIAYDTGNIKLYDGRKWASQGTKLELLKTGIEKLNYSSGLYYSSNYYYYPDVAVTRDHTIYVATVPYSTTYYIYAYIFENETGKLVTSFSLGGSATTAMRYARIVVDPNNDNCAHALFLYYDGAAYTMRVRTIICGASSSLTDVTVAGAAPSAVCKFDWASFNDSAKQYCMAYITAAAPATVAVGTIGLNVGVALNHSTTFGNTERLVAVIPYSPTLAGVDKVFIMSYDETTANGRLKLTCYNEALTAVIATTNIDTSVMPGAVATYTMANMVGIHAINYGLGVYMTCRGNAPATAWRYNSWVKFMSIVFDLVAGTASLNTESNPIWNARIASKPWVFDDQMDEIPKVLVYSCPPAYITGATWQPTQSSYYIIKGFNFSTSDYPFMVCGKALVDTAGVQEFNDAAISGVSNVVRHEDESWEGHSYDGSICDNVLIAGLVKVGVTGTTQRPSKIYSPSHIRTVYATITDNAICGVRINKAESYKHYTLEHNGLMLISGSMPYYFDGAVVEQGFLQYPEACHYVSNNTGGSIGDGVYYYRVLYEWLDSCGNIHRSAPSATIGPVTCAGAPAGASSVEIYFPGIFGLTQKGGVRGIVFRTKVGASTDLMYRVGYSDIVSTDGWVLFLDTVNDSSLVAAQMIYTTGGVIENIQPSGYEHHCIHQARHFYVPMEHSDKIVRYSKNFEVGTDVGFNDLLEITIPADGGDITAMFSFMDRLFVCKQDKIWFVSGTGYQNAGDGTNYSAPSILSDVIGCINAKSVVMVPDGVIFLSKRGFVLLDSSLQINHIGSSVKYYTDLYGSTLSGCGSIPEKGIVQFFFEPQLTFDTTNPTTITDRTCGDSLAYSYVKHQWFTFDGMGATDAVTYNGEVYWKDFDSMQVRKYDSSISVDQYKWVRDYGSDIKAGSEGNCVWTDGSIMISGNCNNREVYVYTYNSGLDSWEYTRTITSSLNCFGNSVFRCNGITVIGSYFYDSSKGAISIYDSSWNLKKVWKGSDEGLAADSDFGWHISMVYHLGVLYIAVGAPGISTDTGKVFVYTYNESTNTLTACTGSPYQAAGLGAADRFGNSISLSHYEAASYAALTIGALTTSEVYYYKLTAGAWVYHSSVTGAVYPGFGHSVASLGGHDGIRDWIAVGSNSHTHLYSYNVGASWSGVACIPHGIGDIVRYNGCGVCLSECPDTGKLLVGIGTSDPLYGSTVYDFGREYVQIYRQNDEIRYWREPLSGNLYNEWDHIAAISDEDHRYHNTGARHEFGVSSYLSGNTLAIGAQAESRAFVYRIHKPKLLIETGWFSFGQVLGYQMLYQLALIGYNISAHQLRLKTAYNFDPTWTDNQTFLTSGIGQYFDLTSFYGDGLSSAYADKAYILSAGFSKQRCTSVRLQISDEQVTSNVLSNMWGYAMAGLGFLLGVKPASSYKQGTSREIP